MVTTLYLIRHGATEGSEVKRYKGSIDVPMSEKGIEQIRGAAAFISATVRAAATPELSAVYSSPLSRALKSAEIIAEPFGLTPIAISDLRERSFGIWEGMSFNEIREQYPEEFDAWAGNPLKFSPVGGESTLEVRDRVISALNKIIDNHKGNVPDLRTKQSGVVESGLSPSLNIAITAHGGVNRIILCHVIGIPLENIFRIEQDNAAINIIEFWDKYPVVKLLNGVALG
ncbi:MAG TPA: histidine phosphatase family protein [Nitrospiraceae bacterium]|nr:MAG: hypothetical protein A2Z82_04325 [Nitrospirae bacterium GWA2_46_11]OGW25846.1 MAG: hypothetical protein A2X55_03020 [Nitrospirae bacterium GWB2_47_37]HAK89256.1 histidine phosphatase family protein [Nitrospiraceae bacterium]HCL82143.1 hypothetical protein [Nitrospiraceae bacterium]HCZ11899.1 histidine phosphatase family protein [Nitrospiraceae bacterium]